ncbi:MAG: transcriptional repressor [Rhodospirillales bacterium]|nr:transcriptional repressor [Rhodospirillales bacterium]USO08645.1 MAG: transcriptional repressor [Rhodospirillales bacterium]
MTGQRRTVLQVLTDATDHPSVETVLDRARAIDPSISMATVYRTLNLLDEMDLVDRREFGQNFARFEVNADHHHHLIDLDSGAVIEFQNENLERLKAEIARDLGYDLVHHTLELYGRKIKGGK